MSSPQANVEYFFRVLYDCLNGACYGSMAGLSAWFAHLWIWIASIGYLLALAGLFVIVYSMIRLYELREREKDFYSTPILPPEAKGGMPPRWQHIQSLLDSPSPSEKREAIIEADIMLDDVLAGHGYVGDGLGEKLKSADPADFKTLQNAWEAHKVRNQIAHQGSSFDLSDMLAQRTIAQYESVFREFHVI